MAKYVHAGKTIDYTPTEDVAAESVLVFRDLICIAILDIPANTLGALTIEGVFDFPKTTGAGWSVHLGSKIYWDEENSIATGDNNGEANKYIGKAVADASEDDTTVRVKLDQ